MTFYAFGLNFETAPVAVREVFALDEAAQRTLYRTVPLSEEAELLLLSTCNRTEVYLYGTTQDVATVQAALSVRAGQPWPAQRAFFLEDEAAIAHLLQVTAGLRSQVVGDAQILAQVKDAYRLAAGEDYVGTVLHRLVHTAFRTAKRVITETALTSGAASVPTAAVAEARSFFDLGLAGRRVLVLGAGQMARLTLQALAGEEPAEILLANRTRARAEGFAETHGARLIDWAQRYDALREVDVVIAATGADVPVLEAAEAPARADRTAPLLLVDIAVPRNIDPAFATQPGCALIDLDTLQAGVDEAAARRRAEIPAAQQLCDEALGEYVAWVFHQQALQPAIHAIRETFESIRLQELERHHGRFSSIDRAELDRLTTSIIQKILAVPVVRLKSVDPESIDFVHGIRLLHALFARPTCEDPSATASPAAPLRAAPSDQPALCPFEPEDAADPEALLRAALRLPRRGDA